MATNVKEKRPSFKERFKGTKIELKKVVWPTKKELTSYTLVVIAICALFALLFWIIDTGTLAALRAIIG